MKEGVEKAPFLQLFGKGKSEALDQIYYDSMENLKLFILAEYDSIKKFCETHDIDRFNLNKIFANKYDKEMSIGLYLRCLVGLGLVSKEALTEEALSLNVSLRAYLKVNNNLIMQSLILMQY